MNRVRSFLEALFGHKLTLVMPRRRDGPMRPIGSPPLPPELRYAGVNRYPLLITKETYPDPEYPYRMTQFGYDHPKAKLAPWGHYGLTQEEVDELVQSMALPASVKARLVGHFPGDLINLATIEGPGPTTVDNT